MKVIIQNLNVNQSLSTGKRHIKNIISKGFKRQPKCSTISKKQKIRDNDLPSVHKPKIKRAKLEPQHEFVSIWKNKYVCLIPLKK